MSGRRAPAETARRRINLVFAGSMTALALAALDQNIVATALPRIARDLGGLAQLPWITTAFMAASVTTAPLYGRLSDAWGRRSAFAVSIGLFLLGSTLCGASRSIVGLIGFRAVQGLGAGGLLTLAQAAVGDVVGPRERGRYQGLFAAVFAGASVAGPLVGGAITASLSWRWIFYVNLPVGLAALAVLWLGLPRRPRVPVRVDGVGAVLLAIVLGASLLLLDGGGVLFPWRSAAGFALAGAAAAGGVALWCVEARAAAPILPLDILRVPALGGIYATLALAGMGLFAAAVYLPLFFQMALGHGPVMAGLLICPMMGGVVTASTLSGRRVSRTARYRTLVASGLAVAGASFAALACCARALTGGWPVECLLATLGLGIGVSFPNLTTALQNAVPRSDLGAATGLAAFSRSVGGILGVTVAGAIVTSRLPHGALAPVGPVARHADPAYAGPLALAFAAGAIAVTLASVAAALTPEMRWEPADAASPRPAPDP